MFSTFGGMSGCTNVVYSAYLLSLRRGVPGVFLTVVLWPGYAVALVFRCGVQQLLVSGEHAPSGCPTIHRALDLALIEGQVPFP